MKMSSLLKNYIKTIIESMKKNMIKINQSLINLKITKLYLINYKSLFKKRKILNFSLRK